jgi:hypothetical protein
MSFLTKDWLKRPSVFRPLVILALLLPLVTVAGAAGAMALLLQEWLILGYITGGSAVGIGVIFYSEFPDG